MRHSLMLLSAIALLVGSSGGVAQAQKLDANGRCHAANGQFAKAEVCGGFGAVTAKLDAGGRCRDASGHYARAEVCGARAPSVAARSSRGAVVAPAAAAPVQRTKIPVRCKTDNGRFAKCGSPGAHPQ